MEETAIWLFLHRTHSDFPFFLPQDFMLPELFLLYIFSSCIKRNWEENARKYVPVTNRETHCDLKAT